MRSTAFAIVLLCGVIRFAPAQDAPAPDACCDDPNHHAAQAKKSEPITVVKKVTAEDLAAGRQVLLPMPTAGNLGETYPLPDVGIAVHYDDTPPPPYEMHFTADEIAALNTRIPSATLVDQRDRQVPLESLKGRAWVAAFIFTRCAGPCPVMSAAMKRLQTQFTDVPTDNVAFVSITVDPTYDTPAVLSQYAERFSADNDRWLMLTGEYKTVFDLANSVFGVGLSKHGTGIDDVPGRLMAVPLPETIVHSRRLVLIDKDMIIRGFYEGIEPAEVDRCARDLRTLLEGNHPLSFQMMLENEGEMWMNEFEDVLRGVGGFIPVPKSSPQLSDFLKQPALKTTDEVDALIAALLQERIKIRSGDVRAASGNSAKP